MSPFRVFMAGWRRAGRAWRLGLLLYLSNLGSGLLLVAWPAGRLWATRFSSALGAAADGVDLWLILELVLAGQADALLGTALAELVQSGLRTGLWLLLLVPPLVVLPATFLRGGILSGLNGPQDVAVERFLRACWRWWGVFLGLMLLQAIVVILLLVAAGLGLALLAALVGPWLWWPGLALLAGLVLVWLALVELSAAAAIHQNRRNLLVAGREALRLLVRYPGIAAGFFALSGAGLLALHGLFRGGLLPAVPATWWVLVFLGQQLFVALRLGTRLARWAGALALFPAAGPDPGLPAALARPVAPGSDPFSAHSR